MHGLDQLRHAARGVDREPAGAAKIADVIARILSGAVCTNHVNHLSREIRHMIADAAKIP
ncbi:MAG TPA: hypothetical protein VGD80_43090 [Kofleriaceae bacterium]